MLFRSARYTHLVDADVDEVFLGHHGIKKKNSEPRLPVTCICGCLNSFDGKYCMRCSKPLNLKEAIVHDENYESLIQRAEMLEKQNEKIMQTIEALKSLMSSGLKLKKT